MSKREILAGSTDQTIDVFIQDSSSTVGAGLTGLAHNTSGLTCYYRKGATGTPTALTLASQTVGGAHADGGFVAVDGTNCPGQYRLDLSDTIVASAGMVTLYLHGAANMMPCVLEIEVVSSIPLDAAAIRTALGMASADLDAQLDAIWTTALTEAYRSTGSTGTAAQLLYEILQNITEFSISGTTKTVKKIDGSSTAKTYTLDSETAPTAITETT